MTCYHPKQCWQCDDGSITFNCANRAIRGPSMYLPCGKCFGCRRKKAREWGLRVQHELRGRPAAFCTLTYSDEELIYAEHSPVLFYRDVQLFFKRLRKAGFQFRYLAAGEYGERLHRPHYHILFLGVCPSQSDLERFWPHGFVQARQVKANDAAAMYTASYTTKKLLSDYEPEVKPFLHASQGLGKEFALANWSTLLRDGFIISRGYKFGLPRYYCKKIQAAHPDDYDDFSAFRSATLAKLPPPDYSALAAAEQRALSRYAFLRSHHD